MKVNLKLREEIFPTQFVPQFINVTISFPIMFVLRLPLPKKIYESTKISGKCLG